MASGYSVYEEENQHLQEGLRAKVSALKSVSVSLSRVSRWPEVNMRDSKLTLSPMFSMT